MSDGYRRDEQRQHRLALLREALEEDGLQGVVITSQASLSWLFAGRYHVGVASEAGVAQTLVTLHTVEGLVANNEHERLVNEENFVVDVCHVYPWYDERKRDRQLREWLGRELVLAEAQWGGLQTVRTQFTETSEDMLRLLGRDAAHAVEYTCRQTHALRSEQEVAGQLATACYSIGIEPVTVLVAGSRRARLYKHPLPTQDALDQFAIVSLCGRRNGVVVSLTRMVAFGPIPDDLAYAHEAVLMVDARLMIATKPGQTLDAIMQVAVAAYQDAGVQDAWQNHHQGGLAGYLSREMRAAPRNDHLVRTGELYAWNPTLPGVKSEDTLLVTANGPQVLTTTGAYPTKCVTVGQNWIERPDILLLSK